MNGNNRITPRAGRLAATIPTLLAAMLVAGCSALQVVSSVSPLGDTGEAAGIEYAPDSGLKLDVYMPAGIAENGPRPVLIFVYGGSWQNGSRGDYRFVASTLAREGFVVVIPDYRLYPKVTFPAFVDDIAAATAWVFDNAGDYGGDPARVFLAGHSAGAHIAALVHYDERYLQRAGATRSVCGLIGLSGPYDFLPLVSERLQRVFPESGRDASQPINFVDGGEGPALLLHGLQDKTVKPRNSASLAEKAQAAGGQARVRIYDERGHAGLLLGLARPLSGLAPVAADMADFVRATSCGTGNAADETVARGVPAS